MEIFAAVGWLLALAAGGGLLVLSGKGTELREAIGDWKSKAEQLEGRLRKALEDRDLTVKRVTERAASDKKYGAERLVKDLVDVLDNFDRALEHIDGEDPLAQGVSVTRDQLLATLARHGIERIDAVGARFDPAIHEAVATEASVDHDEDTVLKAWLPGYRMHDRLIRAAKVVIAVAPPQIDEAQVAEEVQAVALVEGAAEE